MTHRVLLLEDSPHLSRALKRALNKNCIVDQVPTLTGAYNYLEQATSPYTAVIIDRTLPDGDGLELVEYVRQASPHTLICIFSAKTEKNEKISALRDGADCYLAKPLSPDEFFWHFLALLRRERRTDQSVLHFGELRLHLNEHKLQYKDQTCHLTKRELQIMNLLFRHKRGIASLEQLQDIFLDRLSQDAARPSAVIHVMMRRLRRKLEPLHCELHSQYGSGYQIVLPT